MAKSVSFTGSVATFRTVGNVSTSHILFTIENTTGSGLLVGVRRLMVQLDATAALTSFMPLVKTSRIASASSGTVLSKGTFDTAQSSSSNVILRGANASDGGTATPITGTSTATMWQQYCMRMHSVVGQVLSLDNNLLPSLVENDPVVLRENEGLIIEVVSSAGTSNPATNHWFVQCVWEEYTIV